MAVGVCKKSQMPLAADESVVESSFGLVHFESRRLARTSVVDTSDTYQMRVAFQARALDGEFYRQMTTRVIFLSYSIHL